MDRIWHHGGYYHPGWGHPYGWGGGYYHHPWGHYPHPYGGYGYGPYTPYSLVYPY